MIVNSQLKGLLAKCGILANPEIGDDAVNLAPWAAYNIDLSEPLLAVLASPAKSTQSMDTQVDRVNQVGGETQYMTLSPGLWRFKFCLSGSRQNLAAGAEITDRYALDIMDPANSRIGLASVQLSNGPANASVFCDYTLCLQGTPSQVWTLIARAAGATGAGIHSVCQITGIAYKLL